MERPRLRCWIGLHGAVLLFGLAGLFGKLLALSPLVIVFGRTVFASLALLLVLRITRRQPALSLRDASWALPAGILLAFHWGTFFHSIQVSTVAVGLLTFSSYPLFVTFLEPCFFRERLRRTDLLTAVGVAAGLALIVPAPDLSNRLTQGAGWGILSGLSFALLSLLNRRLVRRHSPVILAAGQNLVASLVLLPLAAGRAARLGLRDLLLLGVLGVFCTALAHALFIGSLARLRAHAASVVAGLESVYGILFALLLLGEVPPARTLAGGALILGAVSVAALTQPSDDPLCSSTG